MKKTTKALLVVLGLAAGFSLAPVRTWAGAVISSISPIAMTFTSSAPSGTNGFACRTNGCRVDLGTGTNDHFTSNGTDISTLAGLSVGGAGMTSTGKVVGLTFDLNTASALDTCGSTFEGRIRRLTGTGGTNSGLRSRFCVCTSDGAASPTYAWVNIVSGTVGNSTTCSL